MPGKGKKQKTESREQKIMKLGIYCAAFVSSKIAGVTGISVGVGDSCDITPAAGSTVDVGKASGPTDVEIVIGAVDDTSIVGIGNGKLISS